MSTLSKIFVVLNFVLALAFMMASLTLYSKKINWVEEAKNNVIERNELFRQLKELQSVYDSRIQHDAELVEKLNGQIKAHLNTISEVRQTNTRQATENADLRRNLDGLQIAYKELQTNLTNEQDKNVQLQKDTDQMRKERDTAIMAREFAETQAIESMADLKEAEAELLQVSKRNHELVSRCLQADILLNAARDQGFDPKKVVDGPVYTTPVEGRVLQVEEAVGIVILSLGQKDQIRNGTEFVISRGSKYIGKVRVRNIYEDMCSAVILPDVTQESIEVNDIAQTVNM